MMRVLNMSLDEWRVYFRRETDDAGGVRAMARRLDVSAAYVSDVLLGKRTPGPRILRPYGFRAERTTIVRIVKDVPLRRPS